MPQPTNFDLPGSLETVWAALNEYDDSQKVWPDDSYRFINGEKNRDDICTAMAWITEGLGLDLSTADDSTNGEYVERPEASQTEQDMDFLCACARDFKDQMEAESEADGDDADYDTLIDIKRISEALERLGR